MHAWTLSFTVVRTSAPLPCFGASHLYPATRLVSAPPVFTTRVSVTPVSRARALEDEPSTAFRRNGPSVPWGVLPGPTEVIQSPG